MTINPTPTASTPQPKRILGLSYTEIGILAVLLCVGCVIVGAIFRTFITRTFLSAVPEAVQQTTRPNYKQMLEANGFVYNTNDSYGDPVYVSSCGCVATIKPNSMGFGVYYDPNNDCPIKDLGAIISIMYPSEVFDFIVSNMNSAIVQDTTVHGTASGYDINIDFDRNGNKLIMVIRDPPLP